LSASVLKRAVTLVSSGLTSKGVSTETWTRSHILALAATAVLATGGGLALASCGSDGKSPVGVAQAANTTAEKGTARVTMHMRLRGMGLPLPVELKATGVTALAEPRARLSINIGPLLALGGAPPGGDQNLEVTFDGADLYVKPPQLGGLTIPDGKRWVALDLKELAESAGLPTKGLGALLSIDPASELRALKAAKKLKEVGEEEVDGVHTTHFRGTIRLSDSIPGLPPDERADARKALKALDSLRLGGERLSLNDPSTDEIWVDEDGVVRRMSSTSKVPAAGGTPAGSMSFSYSLHDFGVKLDTGGPPPSERFDATEKLKDAIKNGGGQP
jgi:hypothetical protein